MCAGSIIVGQRTFIKVTQGQVAGGDTVSIGSDPNRVGILFCANGNQLLLKMTSAGSSRYWYAVGQSAGRYNSEMFRIEEYGQQIVGPWYAEASGGAVDYMVIEYILEPTAYEAIEKGKL